MGLVVGGDIAIMHLHIMLVALLLALVQLCLLTVSSSKALGQPTSSTAGSVSVLHFWSEDCPSTLTNRSIPRPRHHPLGYMTMWHQQAVTTPQVKVHQTVLQPLERGRRPVGRVRQRTTLAAKCLVSNERTVTDVKVQQYTYFLSRCILCITIYVDNTHFKLVASGKFCLLEISVVTWCCNAPKYYIFVAYYLINY